MVLHLLKKNLLTHRKTGANRYGTGLVYIRLFEQIFKFQIWRVEQEKSEKEMEATASFIENAVIIGDATRVRLS